MEIDSKAVAKRIKEVAQTHLGGLGFRQRNWSRFWYRDHGIWAGGVEFQPSSFSKGSYLNITATWLWSPHEQWTFDVYERAGTYVSADDSLEFETKIDKLASIAREVAVALSDQLRNASATRDFIAKTHYKTARGFFHYAIASGLSSDFDLARKLFEQVLAFETDTDWKKRFQEKAEIFLTKCVSEAEFRQLVRVENAKHRALLKLPALVS